MAQQEITNKLLFKVYTASDSISYRDLESLTGMSKGAIRNRVKKYEEEEEESEGPRIKENSEEKDTDPSGGRDYTTVLGILLIVVGLFIIAVALLSI